MRNDYTVCYAESGEGKSSLIDAGVCPVLRRELFFPIHIRFNKDDYECAMPNFSSLITTCIQNDINEYNQKYGTTVQMALSSEDFIGKHYEQKLKKELSKAKGTTCPLAFSKYIKAP